MAVEADVETAESRKRRRERRVAVFFALGFVVSTLLQVFLTNRRLEYGFVQSLLYFGLLHLNVILIMFLVFLVARNLTRAYLARRTGTLGSSLRWRMVTSLLAFSLVPSALLFVGSTVVIRQGFDRWFGTQVATALDDAQAITQVHYAGIEKNLGFFARQVGQILRDSPRHATDADLRTLLDRVPVEGAEIYVDLVSPPTRALAEGVAEWSVPRAAVESLQRAFAGEGFQLIRQFGDADLVQQFTPLGSRGVLVLSQTVPLGLKTRMAELRSAFSEYQKIRLFKDSLKTNYTLVLLTLFVLVLFVVSWFGLYIAKSVTEPVSELLRGTEAFREGRWEYRIPTPKEAQTAPAAADLEILKSAFNLMASEVGQRGRKLEEANAQLISLVHELEERERYLETLLSSIRRGVLVIDNEKRVQRINAEALDFASATAGFDQGREPLGLPWRVVFEGLGSDDETKAWLEEARVAGGNPVDRIFEQVSGTGRESSVRSIRATGIHIRDERRASLGWLVILEDVSDAARLERLAAWQEVARRVAHEIKNPLTPLQISADRLNRRMAERMKTDVQDGPVFRECMEQIQKQIRVIRDLVREFSQFAKLPEPKFRDVELRGLLQDILDDYRFTHPDVKFAFRPEGESAFKVRADGEYMRRLIVNLTDNAVHSMSEAGVEKPEFTIEIRGVEDGEFIRIDFIDNGPGVPPEMREKIFDPYVSSKASGLGLGLAIVRRIASEHRGRVRCEAGPGGRFVLELPAAAV